MLDFKFEIVKHFATLSTNSKGWSKEINLVSWNGREAKYDIREWDVDHIKMSKGLTFTKEEFSELKNVLNQIEIE